MAGELTSLTLIIGTIVFAAAAIGYTVIAILLLVARPGTRQANWLLVALFVSAGWSVCHIVLAWRAKALVSGLPLLDAAHIVAWSLFLSSLMLGAGNTRLSLTLGRLIGALAVTLGIFVAGQIWLSGAGFFSPATRHFGQLPVLGLTLLGLFALEQIFRNANDEQRPFLRWLVGGIGALLIVETFSYSQALLFQAVQPDLWVIAGFVNAAAVPLILIAIKRQPDWGSELYVSRQLAFYSTVLTGAGFYLFTMGIGGFLLGSRDQAWGAPVQLVFLGLAAAVFVYGLYSGDVRRWSRIFISKHFFRERYDYRAEWLRLTRALAAEDDPATLGERGLRALGGILSSPGGVFWLKQAAADEFTYIESFGSEKESRNLPLDDEMVRFLRSTQWVVDTNEYLEDPSKYGNAFDLESPWLAKAAVVFPLIHGGTVIGIVSLDRPALLGSLNFKDHDLLKTAGQQVAVFLAQQRAQDALSETRQFEAYSKLTAFLMHDLKNLISQQELVVGNARRFRERPEFIDDALQTIDASVKRMRTMLDRFRSMTVADQASRIDVDTLVRQVCEDCSDREPPPVISGNSGTHVSMDKEKLATCLTHAIRNAQDATSKDGTIRVGVVERNGKAVIEVSDSGCGMDANFIRDRLFRPFASTKGARGMGIGAYQMRETMQAAGGGIEVESIVGEGTTMRFLLPIDIRTSKSEKQSVA